METGGRTNPDKEKKGTVPPKLYKWYVIVNPRLIRKFLFKEYHLSTDEYSFALMEDNGTEEVFYQGRMSRFMAMEVVKSSIL